MVLRIIILTVAFAIITFGIVMFFNAKDRMFIPLILLSSLVFSIILLREVYKNFVIEFKPVQNTAIDYQSPANHELGSLRKISERPFFFGLEKKLVSDNEFYFDEQNFYAINKDGEQAIFPLKDIVELSGTSVTVSQRRIWKVYIDSPTGKIEFKLAPNYTIWNKSFEIFYQKVKSINPEAVKTKWTLWRM
ncbi:hypothetical protein [Pedobacter xixiisoli]|uniref:Uncharacterized protein n=1 Tax=Pedobacter xixiisoli TaxID=1476464 RepID=A0A286A8W0_9SPHI|nr:hypothetical protein [Pedobacter xixiisoli]SOD18350.1 hypothetical protein SAMN06297358_2955 [Pedobacter xixiisoli]